MSEELKVESTTLCEDVKSALLDAAKTANNGNYGQVITHVIMPLVLRVIEAHTCECPREALKVAEKALVQVYNSQFDTRQYIVDALSVIRDAQKH